MNRGNYYKAILRKQTNDLASGSYLLQQKVRKFTSARRLRKPVYETRRYFLASLAFKEHLTSLEDLRIKYNVQTKNITKGVSFKLKTSLNTRALFECSCVCQLKLDMNIFHIISVEFMSLLFN